MSLRAEEKQKLFLFSRRARRTQRATDQLASPKYLRGDGAANAGNHSRYMKDKKVILSS